MAHEPLHAGASIAVVGAGIIGTSAAFALSERGYAVTLFDRAEPGRTGPSFGNAGHIAADGIFPLASPGIGVTGMKMMLDPGAPLKIPRAYARQIAPWLWRFWRTSYGEAQEAAIAALTELARDGVEEAEALWRRAGFAQLLTRKSCLSLYESEASFRLAGPQWRRQVAAGFAAEPVDAVAIRELEPSLAPIFPRGWLSHAYGHVSDPFEVVTAMFNAAVGRGVMFRQARVDAVRGGDGAAVVSGGVEQRFDAVLVSAGAWSKGLAETLGEQLPVEAERGYNLTFAAERGRINHPLLFADRGLAATPLAIGLRFGGWTELGGVTLPPDPARWSAIRRIGEEVLPGIGAAEAHEWMGHRPSLPDSVPAIARSGKASRVFYAVGHGHYGLSCSAKTARFATELIGDGTDEKFAGFSMKRFN